MGVLCTHSLLSAWLYAMKANPYEDASSEVDPMAQFMQVLRREPTETTKAMQNGIDFEDYVTALTNGEDTGPANWRDGATRIANIVRGGSLQHKARKIITVKGKEVCLYGRLDCLLAGHIYDIKFSQRYERGKYLTSTQHPTYLEIVPEAVDFTYLVSNGTDVWTEKYTREETPSIYPVIENFFDWLDVMQLTALYSEKWASK